ncbi:MAG: hypothetical protein OEV99_06735 [Nitrospira sp.]|nr:hypothetical protein [Nitrospira sp.]MDH4369527.1 hypothetical protein [Nitrospira sp.]MDH5496043.1 hypothetical protein [Nitrospira sp.]MDH5724460.1 hypothetical protein [Nitrospira sp.]
MRTRDQLVVWMAIGLVALSAVWALRTPPASRPTPSHSAPPTLPAGTIPLVTGDEPIADVFTRAGCSVCHIIPGIPGANGRVGPPLVLGTTGLERLTDPGYHGNAQTVHDYIVESVLEPQQFVVHGYPEHTMPNWYGSKLSALALEKIALYLTRQTEADLSP